MNTTKMVFVEKKNKKTITIYLMDKKANTFFSRALILPG